MTPLPIHSPRYNLGPWYVGEAAKRGFNVYSPRGAFLAWIGPGSNAQEAANAQLMAAAPKLLDACKMLLTVLIRDCDMEAFGSEISQAEGVIAEAEGPATAG